MTFPRVLASPLLRAAFCLLFALFLSGCSGGKDDTLVVGMELSYPPFEMLDEQGRPSGVSVDLANALAADLGRPLRIENIPFVGLIPALKSGRVDMVISSMTDTPERRESIAFSDPYVTTGIALLVPKNSPVQSLADLDQPGRTLAVRQGTTGESWARGSVKQARILPLEKESGAVLEVLQGRADAFLYDQMSVWTNWRQHPDKLRPLLHPVRVEQWAIGLPKDDPALRDQVNAFLRKFRAEGGFERLGEKYLKDQKADFAAQGIPFYF